MVKYKNFLIQSQVLTLFLIPLTPHYVINTNFHTDDIPVLLFLILFLLNIYFKNIKSLFIKKLIPLSIFILYIGAQNMYLNESLIFSDFIRYIFYLLILIFILNIKDLIKFNLNYVFLFLFLSTFSILFYFFKIDLGTDSYDYWNIGFNSNQWNFTKGRMNGFQAGGPNAFGGLIASLACYCLLIENNINKNFVIVLGTLGCFFTYSRGALIILVVFIIFHLIKSKNVSSLFLLIITLLFTSAFGLVDRFTSEVETEGIEDRIEMQEATFTNFSERTIYENIFGYGYDNYGVVRNTVQSINEFDEDLRPTGPHNSFLFIILNYGFLGLLLFINIFFRQFIIFLKSFNNNIKKPEYFFLGSFVALSFSGDFIQNHSISVLFFFTFFTLMSHENEK
jgi:O-antigen ligase